MFDIAISGLKLGEHQFQFSIDESFFEQREYSLIQKVEVEVDLLLNRESENQFDLTINLEGKFEKECDRCMSNVNLPISASTRLLVLLKDRENEGNEEIWYLPMDANYLNLGDLFYELISVEIPLRVTCDIVEDKKCDQQAINMLKDLSPEEQNRIEGNPVWDKLKNLRFDK